MGELTLMISGAMRRRLWSASGGERIGQDDRDPIGDAERRDLRFADNRVARVNLRPDRPIRLEEERAERERIRLEQLGGEGECECPPGEASCEPDRKLDRLALDLYTPSRRPRPLEEPRCRGAAAEPKAHLEGGRQLTVKVDDRLEEHLKLRMEHRSLLSGELLLVLETVRNEIALRRSIRKPA